MNKICIEISDYQPFFIRKEDDCNIYKIKLKSKELETSLNIIKPINSKLIYLSHDDVAYDIKLNKDCIEIEY